jgi:cobalt/nickel transport system permease protein
MHMANELLSVPVAAGTLAIAAAGLSFICRKLRMIITSEKLALMGVLGAFIFAAQMVNIPLPAMPGTSGHIVGAVLLAIILGPHAAAVVISSVVIIQCLIINMALVPSYIGYFLYKTITVGQPGTMRAYIGTILACLFAIEAGAFLVPIETALSGVLAVPFSTFLITMLGVHFLIGLLEGLITIAILGYLIQVRPDIILSPLPGKIRLSKKAVLTTLAVFAVVIGAGLSLLASGLPDGLEWSYAERPDQPDFKAAVSNKSPAIVAADDFQSKYSPLPDYSLRTSAIGKISEEETDVSAAWTSFAGVLGSVLTMAVIWLTAWSLRKKQSPNV